MFLNSKQLKEMTGYQRHSDQVRWLVQNGYHFDVRSDGRPNVLHQQIIERQCKSANEAESKPVPDFSFLNRAG